MSRSAPRAGQRVQVGVGEAVVHAGLLVGQRHHPGEQRGRQAGATDAVLVVADALGEGLGLADEEAGVGVADHRRRRARPGASAGRLPVARLFGHDALLVVGLVEHPARCRRRRRRGSRRGARGVRAGRGVEAADAGRPALLERHAAVGVDAEAGAADGGDERRGGREVGRRDRAAVAGAALVAAVAGGEVEADALDRGLREDALRGVPVGRRALTEVAVRVGDDVGLVPVDEVVRAPWSEVDVVAALDADVVDVGARRHGVHGLDVERLLAVPARRVALVGAAGRERPVRLLGELRLLERVGRDRCAARTWWRR